MPSPAVSVVIPTRDRLPLLREAVASVLAQTLTDLELLVADDGSADGTLDYLRALPDPRVRALALERTGNIARARNAGATASHGEWLCFLDSDDLWLPNKLAVQLEETQHAGVAWSYTRYEHVDGEGRPAPARAGSWRPLSGRIAAALLAMEAPVALCTVLVRRELFDRLGGFDEDPRLRLREDFHFLVRLALAAETLAVPASVARVREHAGRATRALAGAAPFLATAYAYERLLEVLDDVALRRIARRRRARLLARAGAEHLRVRELLRAGDCLLGAALGRRVPAAPNA